MANIVELVFRGRDEDLKKTLDEVQKKSDGFMGTIGKLGKIGGMASGFVSLANGGMTLYSALTTLAPAALVLPGALLGAAVAVQTFKMATAGFGDALKGDAEALAKLPPAMRESVTAVKSLEGGYTKMTQAVQTSFWKGLAPEIKATGSELLALGTRELPYVAAGFNQMGKEALVAARSPVFQNDLTQIVRGTSGALAQMHGAAANAISGIVGIGGVGAEYLEPLGRWVNNATVAFKGWVDGAVESGRINELIDGAIQGFRDLWGILQTGGQIIATVFRAFNSGLGASATPLDMIKAKLDMFLAQLQTPAAQQALAALGTAIRAISDAFNAVMPYLLQFVFTIANQLLPIITFLANMVGQNAGLFAGLIIGIIAFAAAIKAIIAVATIVRTVIMAWTAVQWLLNLAMSANPLGIVIIAIIAFVAILIYAWNNSETFRAIVTQAWESLKTVIGAVINFIVTGVTNFVNMLISQWNTFKAANDAVWAAVGNAINVAINFVVGLVNGFVGFWNSIPGRIGQALGSLGSIIGGVFKGALNTAINFVNWGIDKINGLISGINYVGGFVGLSIPMIPHIPSFHTGGVVPGPKGSEMLAVLQAGETVVPTQNMRSGGGGRSVTFAGNLSDPLAILIMKMIREGKIQIAGVNV